MKNQETIQDKQLASADKRTELADLRTDWALERTELAKQRNHLANERTFQAWVRTSLSLMGFGFIIEQFSLFLRANQSFLGETQALKAGKFSWIIGEVLIMMAIALMITAYIRFRRIARQLGHTKNFPSKWLTGMVVIFIALGVALLIYDLSINL